MNEHTQAYLRKLEVEFNEGSNAIRLELLKFEKAGLLKSFGEGNRRYFTANTTNPLFMDIQTMVRKYVGINTVVDNVTRKIGNLQEAYLTGSLALGIQSPILELVLVGDNIDKAYLLKLCSRAEEIINKKISYVIFSAEEFAEYQRSKEKELLLIYN